MTTTDPNAHAERPVWPDPDDAVEVLDRTDEVGHEPTPDDDVLVDDDGPDDAPVDPDQRFELIVARAVVAFAVSALALLAATFVLALFAVWTDGETSDDLTSSAAVCFVAAAVCAALVATSPRVLR